MQKCTDTPLSSVLSKIRHLVVVTVWNRVAKQRSSADNLAHREEGQDVDRVDTQLGQVLLVWLEFRNSLQSSLLLSRGLQEVEELIVHLLKLSLGWRSKAFLLVDDLADLGADFSPVNGAVSELSRFGHGRVEETCGFGYDSRHDCVGRS